MSLAEKAAKILLDIGAVRFSPERPFTYASGLKGPIYTDCRLVMSAVAQRKSLIQLLVQKLQAEKLSFDVVAALATAGIAHGAWLAMEMEKPLIYIRSKPKGHGTDKLVEGKWSQGDRVLLMEDLVNQGSSSLPAVQVMRDLGTQVVGLLSLVNYDFPQVQEKFQRAQCPLYSLTHLEALVAEAKRLGQLPQDQEKSVWRWFEDPEHWQP